MKRIIPLLLLAGLLIGCSGNNEKVVEARKAEKSGKVEEKIAKTDRAVFAWEGVDEEGLEVIQKYGINTILLDYNHTSDLTTLSSSNRSTLSSSGHSTLASYNIFILAGSPEWGTDEMSNVVKEAEALGADGVVFDIESDYAALADNLEKLNTDLPVYVCIPFWLDELEKGNELIGEDGVNETGEEVVERIIKSTDGVFIMNYYKGEEGKQIKTEKQLAEENKKQIWTIYELQPPGVYDLKEYNTYYSDGIEAVENNYKEQFYGTDVGIAFHNLEMMKELDK